MLCKFTVRGKSQFPLDMLSLDMCFPLDKEDVKKVELSVIEPYKQNKEFIEITLATIIEKEIQSPSIGLWQSYGWEVLSKEYVKEPFLENK